MIDTREIATAKIVMVGGNGGGGGTSNYNQLNNKPSINGVTLQGNKTSADLNIDGMPETPLATSHGGTGNADGYIRKGVAQGSTVGNGATAEGYGNTASGDYCHAEGSGNTASSYHTHAEGAQNVASAPQAHAQGYGNTASGAHSHAGGAYTVAGYANQTAIGTYNDNKSTTLLEVGNGTADNARSNAFEVHSNGNIVAGGTVSDANGVLNAVAANNSDAPTSLLNKLKIGSATYDATAVKPYTVSSITSGTTGVIRVNTISTNSIDGDLIAITTGSNSGTTTNAWALTFYDGGTLSPLELKKADGTGYTDAITENQLLFVIPDLSNSSATVVGVAGASGGGASTLANLTDTDITSPTDGQVLAYNGTSQKWENQYAGGSGNTKLKTRYSVTYSSWSSAVNSDGYYTYSLSLNPTITTSFSPDVLIAGSSNITQPTDTEKTMFGYVERCYLSSSTLTLYAKTKPTSTFYIWVEGVAGSGSGGIVGNVIQPNGSGGIGYYETDEIVLANLTWGASYSGMYSTGILNVIPQGKKLLSVVIFAWSSLESNKIFQFAQGETLPTSLTIMCQNNSFNNNARFKLRVSYI